jgi:hypothetical protein
VDVRPCRPVRSLDLQLGHSREGTRAGG